LLSLFSGAGHIISGNGVGLRYLRMNRPHLHLIHPNRDRMS